MPAGRFLLIVWVTTMSVLGTTGCTPRWGSQAGAVISSTTTVSDQAQNSGQAGVIDMLPQAVQPMGQSAPGAGAPGLPAEPDAPGRQLQPGAMTVYTDNAYMFRVEHPSDFVVRAQAVERLAQLSPKPSTALILINPVIARSDVVELEPADLEIRVYVAEQGASLDTWLTSNNLLPADGSAPAQPFQTAHVAGLRVCAMIAPGCSYFVLGDGRIYQLIPATLAGEAMIKTFSLIR